VTGRPVTGAEARHEIANLLHTYTDIADRKDVSAAVALVGSARVRFPAGGFDAPAQAAAFFTALWASPLAHRHDVSNLVVLAGDSLGTWTARAHYTRWVLDPAPTLHTLGEYTLVISEPDWAVVELTVTRTWSTV
jgi:SnoaL-like protein